MDGLYGFRISCIIVSLIGVIGMGVVLFMTGMDNLVTLSISGFLTFAGLLGNAIGSLIVLHRHKQDTYR